MGNEVAPTKGNLLAVKKSLALAKTGFELLDRKRNILIREMMSLIDRSNAIQNKIDATYEAAYLALQKANITLGICSELSGTVPVEESLSLSYRSVMGVEIPKVSINPTLAPAPFGLYSSNTLLDGAYLKFNEVKVLTAELAEVENSVYRLAAAIKKTQKRANALKNIVIPRYTAIVKAITEALEEKDIEEFSRMKTIKKFKLKKSGRE